MTPNLLISLFGHKVKPGESKAARLAFTDVCLSFMPLEGFAVFASNGRGRAGKNQKHCNIDCVLKK